MKAKRILIIDDERPLLETLEMFLTEKGYAVGCAMSAREGLKQCTVFDPHVIILDIRLPDMNGLDVLQELIRNGRKNIIIITAFHDMDITIKAVKFGAFDYTAKPIDVEELDRVIDKALKSIHTGIWGKHASFWGFPGPHSAINSKHTKFQAARIQTKDAGKLSSLYSSPKANWLQTAIENNFQKVKDRFKSTRRPYPPSPVIPCNFINYCSQDSRYNSC
jgi:DNA-binding response OmpR family regulator